MSKPTKILLVCLGNICRSPMAEGVMRKILDAKYPLKFIIDSAGIGGWHEGESPDPRAIKTAKAHNIDISAQRARQIRMGDFESFDHILVMDTDNLHDARSLSPIKHHHKIRLLMDYPYPDQGVIVPDPYYSNRFEESYQLIWNGCDSFADQWIDSLH